MSIKTQIDRINSAVTEQTDLLAQIQSALEGKAAGGGGGSEPLYEKVNVSDEGMSEPGLNKYTFTSSNLNLSTRRMVIFMLKIDSSYSSAFYTAYAFFRNNISDSLTTVYGNSSASGLSDREQINEDSFTFYGSLTYEDRQNFYVVAM